MLSIGGTMLEVVWYPKEFLSLETISRKSSWRSTFLKNEIELLHLCQGEMTMANYVAKFESLLRFSHYLRESST
ncbi:hypothetical protein CR513_30152, partial [Mucuna pruriens]